LNQLDFDYCTSGALQTKLPIFIMVVRSEETVLLMQGVKIWGE